MPGMWYNECKAFIIIYSNALADTQISRFAPCISGNYTITLRLYGIMRIVKKAIVRPGL